MSHKKLRSRLNMFELTIKLGSEKLVRFYKKNKKLMKKLSKKNYLPISESLGLGSGIAFVLLGVLIEAEDEYTVFPLMLYVMYMSFATIGHYTLPTLLMYELYPLQIRGLLGGISVSSLNIFISTSNWVYPHIRDAIGFSSTVICYGCCSLAGCVFLYIFLPETKGMTLQQIEAYYK